MKHRWGSGPRAACAIVASALTFVLLPASAGAAPAAPGKLELEQPSGRTFDVRQFGDEWYHGYESLSGHTILRDRDTNVWRYAEETAEGELVPEGPRASEPAPDDLDRHLRDESSLERVEEIAEAASAPAQTASPTPANQGDQPVLVILAEFTDRSSQTAVGTWRNNFFGESNSVRDYWDEASYGNLDLPPATESYGTANDGIVGWVQVNRAHPQAGSGTAAQRDTVRAAIDAADPYVNFASFDTDGDGKVESHELHLVVIPAGYEEASCGKNTPFGVWGHNWYASTSAPTVDGKQVGGANANDGGGYSMFGETHCDGTTTYPATIGIMVHEIGHDLDLPDLYSSADGTDGIGAWSVMAGGSWLSTGTKPAGSSPAHPDAWSKYYQGWTTPQQRSGTRSLAPAETTADVMRLGNNPGGVDWRFNSQSGTGEYFLVEFRQQTGYDAGLPGCGFVIWHIDETRTFTNAANSVGTRRLVDLEEADDSGFPWSVDDTFRFRSFNGTTTPNSNFYSGAGSNLGVNDTSGCGSTMGGNFLQTGQISPDNDLLHNAIEVAGRRGSRAGSNVGADDEAGEPRHAFAGKGQSVWYRWTAPGNGQATFDTIGSGFDTVLGVYTGARVNELTHIASNDDIATGSNSASRVSFNATAGQTYRIAVDAFDTASPGAVSLNWSQPIPPPANDNFSNATPVNTNNLFLNDHTNEGATREPGEPNHDDKVGGGSVWYRWTAPADGNLVLDTSGSTFDTVLGLYTGAAVNALTKVSSDDDGGAGNQSRIEQRVVSGRTYRVAVDGYNNDARGTIHLALNYAYDPPNTSITSSPPATTTSTSASFSFSSTGAAGGFECKLDGGSFSSCSTPKNYSGLGTGSHTFSVRATGPGGPDASPASYTWTVEVPLPDPPNTAISSAPSATTTDTNASFSFSSSGVTDGFECRIDRAPWETCAPPQSYTGLGTGPHEFQVRAFNSGGADPTPATHNWSIEDPAPPEPPDTSITSGPVSSTTARNASFAFSATGEATGFECSLDGSSWATCSSPKSYSGLARGAHAFEVRAVGPGGPDPDPDTHAWRILAPPPPPPPNKAPETAILSGPPPKNVVKKRLATEFTFSASESATFTCRVNEGAWAPCTSPSKHSFRAPKKAKTFVFAVRATDSAGMTDATPAEHVFSLKRKPRKRN